ncbi:cysteine desulfurase [Caproiciproducens galactitolivorans]|uniref:cysteine desulfurase n=1 Tax=Caproiciproducens galactitolivorans TaxID=642589 RepID=A0A4Z0Y9V7_9FIRM|nr:cysteine desulfurase family protein [Caproiciproducens galactitolivorans]QEY34958.1 cysteine desulfurase [Caproiciproducens galactitolivorans]TGJ76335.1 cysteine desulfurase IscS [Caproiciproducens galactitolivorans]
MGEIYLDNSATTQVCREAAAKAMEVMTENYGNPSSLHTKGFQAERELTAAREAVAGMLGVLPEEIYFTSGGTESNNLALFGAAHALRRRGSHIVTTAIEHSSIMNTMKQLEKEGYSVTYLEPDKEGRIRPEQVFKAVTPSTILVSMMYVNNEVGTILPLEAVPQAIAAAKAPALFHADAVQAFGKIPVKPKKLKIDLLSISAHKIHGPKGVGALFLRKGVRIEPRAFGGGQEKDIRPGTEAMPLIAGFGAAVKALPDTAEQYAAMEKLSAYCRKRLSEVDDVTLNSPQDACPYIVNFSAGNVRAETMLHFLSNKGIYVSSGSACSKGKESRILTAMGLPKSRIASALRISFSRYNTEQDIDGLVDAVKEGLATLTTKPI